MNLNRNSPTCDELHDNHDGLSLSCDTNKLDDILVVVLTQNVTFSQELSCPFHRHLTFTGFHRHLDTKPAIVASRNVAEITL